MCRLAAELEMQGPAIDGTDLLDALVTSVFLLDQDLHVNYLNAAGQTLLGLGALALRLLSRGRKRQS